LKLQTHHIFSNICLNTSTKASTSLMNPCQKIYQYAGPDHAQYRVHADDSDENVHEIEEYWDG
jgi:hypothetical protein